MSAMNILFGLLILSMAAVPITWFLCKRSEAHDWDDFDSLTPEQQHRRLVFMKYLPQSQFDADLLDASIKRGEL